MPRPMSNLSERYCARGPRCTQYSSLGEPMKLRSSSKSEHCEPCFQEGHAGSARASKDAAWENEVLGAIESVWTEREAAKSASRASLWDLFDLEAAPIGE